LIETTDLFVPFVVQSFLGGAADPVLEISMMLPLEVDKQAFDPLFGRLFCSNENCKDVAVYGATRWREGFQGDSSVSPNVKLVGPSLF